MKKAYLDKAENESNKKTVAKLKQKEVLLRIWEKRICV